MSSGFTIYKDFVSFKDRLDSHHVDNEDLLLSSTRKMTISTILLEAYSLSVEISRHGEYTKLLEQIEILKGRLFSYY